MALSSTFLAAQPAVSSAGRLKTPAWTSRSRDCWVAGAAWSSASSSGLQFAGNNWAPRQHAIVPAEQPSNTSQCQRPVGTRAATGAVATGAASALPAGTQALQQFLRETEDASNSVVADVCNQALQECCRQERWPDVWACYQLAESMGVQLQQDTYTALWQRAIEAYWVTQAVDIFHRAASAAPKPPPAPPAASSKGSSQPRAGTPRASQARGSSSSSNGNSSHGVHSAPSSNSNTSCASQRDYVTIISRLLKLKPRRGLPNKQLAYGLWRELFEAHKAVLDGASLRAGITACSAVGRLGEAERLMSWAREQGLRPGHGAYNRLIAAHARAGAMDAARRVYKAMVEQRYVPDPVTYNTLLWGYSRLGDAVRARAVLDKMKRAGVTPDAWAWSALMHGYARAGDMAAAEAVLQEVLSLEASMGLGPAEPMQAAPGSRSSSNGKGSSRSSSDPASMLEEQWRRSSGSSNGSGSTTANGVAAAGPAWGGAPLNGTAAAAAHAQASAARAVSNGTSNGATSQGPAGWQQAWGSSGSQANGVPRPSGSARPTGKDPDVSSRPPPAPWLLQSSSHGNGHGKQRSGPRLVSPHCYGALVDGYMRAGDPAAAEAAAQRLVYEAGLRPTRELYNTLIRGYCKLGVAGQARAFEIFQQMRAAGVAPGLDTYTTLLAAAGEVPGGSNLLGSESSAGGPGYVTDQVLHMSPGSSSLGGASSRAPSLASPTDTGSAASNGTVGRPPSPLPSVLADLPGASRMGSSSSSSMEDVAGTVASAGVGGQAAVLLDALRADGLPADSAVLTAVMVMHARAERFDLALRTFQEMRASPHSGADVAAWAALASAHVARGALAEAEAATAEAAALAASLGAGPPDAAFTALIRGHVEAGDLPRALAALRRYLVAGGRPRKRVLDTVVLACLRRGETSTAAKVLRAAELTGTPVDRERYQEWFRRAEQQRRSGRAFSPSPSYSSSGSLDQGEGSSSNPRDDVSQGMERLKWWLGLPSAYYEPGWSKPGEGEEQRHSVDGASSSGGDDARPPSGSRAGNSPMASRGRRPPPVQLQQQPQQGFLGGFEAEGDSNGGLLPRPSPAPPTPGGSV